MDSAAEPSGRAPRAGGLAFTGLVGATLIGALFAGGGSGTDGTLPVGGAAAGLLAAAFVAIGAGWLSAPRLGRSGAALVCTATAVAVWAGVTMAWSIVPDRSWDSFNKSVAYVAFLGLGIVVASLGGRSAARLAAGLLALVTGAALAWALLTKAVPGLDPEGDRVARLREPVGYWNALALLADMALVLGLWLGTTEGHRRSTRVAGGLLAYVATLALMLTLSRAGVVVAALVLGFWLAFSRERVGSGLFLVAAASPALLVGAWAFTRPALTEDVAVREDRVADGTIFGVLVLVGATIVALLVVFGSRRSLSAETRARIGRRLAVVVALCAVAAAAGVAVATAHALSDGRDCAEVSNDPSRFGTFGSARLCWWGEAWDVFAGRSPEGAGAGTFEIARKRYRADARSVVEPHSVPLQHLADGGIVGLALLLALLAAAAAVCIGTLRRLAPSERAAAVALVASPLAYLGHALVDYDWNFLAVTAPTMVALGVLAGAGRAPGSARRRPLLVLEALVVAVAIAVSFSFPRLAERMERSSTRAVVANDLELARDRAQWARFFNPLAVEPIFALARVDEARGWPVTAQRRYNQAVELQPENPEAWYTAGIFQFEVRDNLCAAYRYLNEAYTLDPAGNQWLPGGPLDVSRDAVNEGGCAPGS